MPETESAFTFLHDNIPSWLTNLNEIAEKVTAMQSEMTKVSISVAPPMKKKTGSMESIKDGKMDIILEEPSSSTLVQQSSLTPGRKRKTPSVLSGRASGPSKYRSRTMIVIQYDGSIQKSLETLVRNIGTGRNMLRKGKMVAKMQALADLAGSDDDDEDNHDDDDDDPVLSKISYRHRARISSVRVAKVRTTTRGPRKPTSTTPPEVFDSTDRTLEQAQSLCEKAAHQSLREGDCSKELDGVSKYLKEVLEKSEKETTKYKTAHEQSQADAEPGSTSPMDIVIEPDPKPSEPTGPLHSVPIQTPAEPKTTDIEVDDDDDDEDFVMPPVRLMSRTRG